MFFLDSQILSTPPHPSLDPAAVSFFGTCSCPTSHGCAHIVALFLLCRQEPSIFRASPSSFSLPASPHDEPGSASSPLSGDETGSDHEPDAMRGPAETRKRVLPAWMTSAPTSIKQRVRDPAFFTLYRLLLSLFCAHFASFYALLSFFYAFF